MVEYKRGIHEGAWIHKWSSFLDAHSLKIEDKATVENLERQRTLSSKDHDLFVRDLVGIAHVSRNPFGLVAATSWNLLPGIALNVIDLDCVNYSLLIYSSTEREEILVLEAA